MSALLLTLGIAFFVIIIALSFLGISWLVKGKSSLRPGACGRDPNKKQSDEECSADKTSCHLCERSDKEKK